MHTFTVCFDGSLQTHNSGAAFRVPARDEEHAKQILAWLKAQVPQSTAYVELTITKTLTLHY